MGKRNRQKRSKQSAEGEMPVKPSIQEMVEVFTLVKAVLESKLVYINWFSTLLPVKLIFLDYHVYHSRGKSFSVFCKHFKSITFKFIPYSTILMRDINYDMYY